MCITNLNVMTLLAESQFDIVVNVVIVVVVTAAAAVIAGAVYIRSLLGFNSEKRNTVCCVLCALCASFHFISFDSKLFD